MSRSRLTRLSLVAAATAFTAFAAAPLRAAEDAVIIPAPATDVRASDGMQTAVVAGGCFWGVQGVFQHTSGVVNAVSGYAGGSKTTAGYQMVSTGSTGHAESVATRRERIPSTPAARRVGPAAPRQRADRRQGRPRRRAMRASE